MPKTPNAAVRRLLTMLAFAGFGQPMLAARCHAVEAAPTETSAGRLEFDGKSDYSHIRVRRRGDVRTLIFVRDTGEEVLESRINLERPYVLQFEYLKHLFTSYLFRNPQQDVLIVGLGGGGMIHFLRRADPGVRIDAVEIDPVVVELAGKYFGVKSGEHVNIVTADGLKFIAETPTQYDVIYLDAFLKPSAVTDATGVPLSLRTQQFYKQLQTKLKPGGVAAFNINPHAGVRADIQAIAAAFPQAYEFQLPRYSGTVVVASTDALRVDRTTLVDRAAAFEAAVGPRFEPLQFKEMARRLRE
jgi:spermidine synthase